MNFEPLPVLSRAAHIRSCKRFLDGLPADAKEYDPVRIMIGFYCFGTLDLFGALNEISNNAERERWREWIWEQQKRGPSGTAFRGSSYMTGTDRPNEDKDTPYNSPKIIETYTALLSLAILRDDFAQLDRPGLLKFLNACQKSDGSFSLSPGHGDSDSRTTYAVFTICSMLNNWSSINLESAIGFIEACRTYEGGYGQSPACEAHAGTTYTAVACLQLAGKLGRLTIAQRLETVRWLVHNQSSSGGFCGRTNKEHDACYCFWCTASLAILGHRDLVDTAALVSFLAQCQCQFGGIGKVPESNTPDPYHTYLSMATLAMQPTINGYDRKPSYNFPPFDPALNATNETAEWARTHLARQ